MAYARKTLLLFGISFLFLSLVSYTVVHLGYAYSMPRTPDVKRGRILETSVNHGTIVFVTEAELRRKELAERALFLGGPVTLGVIAFVQTAHGRRARN